MTQSEADAAVRGVPTNDILTREAKADDARKVAIFDALARRATVKLARRAAKAGSDA
jgi:hypothetical protein